MITEQILLHHLQALGQDDIDGILSDYAEDAIIFSPNGLIHGLAAIRAAFEGFVKNSPPEFLQSFKIVRQDIDENIGYIIWAAKPFITMATDTFVIRDGKIAVQTYAIFSS